MLGYCTDSLGHYGTPARCVSREEPRHWQAPSYKARCRCFCSLHIQSPLCFSNPWTDPFRYTERGKINPPHVGGDIGNISCPEFIKSIGQKVAFDLVFAIHTITFCLSVRLPFLPRLGIESVFSHNSSNLPFPATHRVGVYSKFLGNLSSGFASRGART